MTGVVVGRFAPSPTGPLHLGSLVAALGSYLLARQAGGRWLVRIEDLDQPRVVPGMADDFLRTLEALGLLWDGEVLHQSQRTAAYQLALERLTDAGLVYPCRCSRADIARIASAPHNPEGELVYPGTCRAGIPPGSQPRSFRLRAGEEPVSFSDGIVGLFAQSLNTFCGDFVIRRADGPFAYHLAVVVDDADQGVTQVARGADLLASTPRQIYLQQLLGLAVPAYFHLPLVTGPHGGKLSKRDNAVSLAAGQDLRRHGGALLAAALQFLGQPTDWLHPQAPCSEILDQAVARFDVTLVPHRPGPFPPLP